MGRPARVTREEVLKAAREAFAVGGFHGTTLADISGRVGVTPAAVLRHAPTKDALFRAAIASGQSGDPLPLAFLATADATGDPRPVLRQLARSFVPFIEAKMDENIACFMHDKTAGGPTFRLRLPFDPRAPQTPPRRGLALLEGYLRRAARAGRIRVRDPRAAALSFLGSLHSFVFLRRVLRVPERPIALERYVDTLIDIWTHGAIRKGRGRAA